MANRSLLYFGAMILISFFGAFALATGMDGQEGVEETQAVKAADACLARHGTFDDLAKATADFTTASGETKRPIGIFRIQFSLQRQTHVRSLYFQHEIS